MLKELIIATRGSGKTTLCYAWVNDIPNTCLLSPKMSYIPILPRGFPIDTTFIIDELSIHSSELQYWAYAYLGIYDFYITIGAESVSRLIDPWKQLVKKEYPEWLI